MAAFALCFACYSRLPAKFYIIELHLTPVLLLLPLLLLLLLVACSLPHTVTGTFSGQPITPRDMAELKHKLEQEGSSIAPKSSRTRGATKQPGSKDASAGGSSAALPPLPTPTSSSGGAAATAHQQQQQAVLRVAAPAEDAAEGEEEEEDVDMLQVRIPTFLPCVVHQEHAFVFVGLILCTY
jgi:hypothetical protein